LKESKDKTTCPLIDLKWWASGFFKNQFSPESSDHLAHNTESEEREQPVSHFAKAIKDAERSLLIFNLDMGQSPIMNPSTMSAKVTVGLLDKKAEHEELDKNNHSIESREFVDNILSQVVKMDFFGKKTGPCKIPGKPELNGKF
jgi:hypothetical protein